MTEYAVPPNYPGIPSTNLFGITRGPHGWLWFTEALGNKIGQIVFTTASLTVSPSSGHFGTPLTFTGSAFAAGENVNIYIRGIGSGVEASATADASGSFTVPGSETLLPYGPHLFMGLGQSSGKLAAATLSVVAGLSLKPNVGTAGSTATVGGAGFGPFELVFMYWNTPRVHLGTVKTDINGSFGGSTGLTFVIPAGAPSGINLILGEGNTGTTSRGSFTVQ
jgi:hypothetical protein